MVFANGTLGTAVGERLFTLEMRWNRSHRSLVQFFFIKKQNRNPGIARNTGASPKILIHASFSFM